MRANDKEPLATKDALLFVWTIAGGSNLHMVCESPEIFLISWQAIEHEFLQQYCNTFKRVKVP